MLFRFLTVFGAAALALVSALTPAPAQAEEGRGLKLVLPVIDSERGRQLFVTKGCVYCHAVNGVGGKAAPAFDTDSADPTVDLAGFIARMWGGARAMIELQEMDLGYQIALTGEELGHLAAFANDPAEQTRFSEDQVPELMREWYLDKIPEMQ